MEVKRVRTSKDEEFVKHLEDLIEKVKAGEVEECKIGVLLTKDAEKKKKHNVEDLSEEDCKRLLHAIFNEDDEDEDDEDEDEDDDEFECDGDCESCENYVPDDPEEVFEDLGRAIGCLVYYNLPLSPTLIATYNEAYFKTKEAEYANSKDS